MLVQIEENQNSYIDKSKILSCSITEKGDGKCWIAFKMLNQTEPIFHDAKTLDNAKKIINQLNG